MKKTIIVLTLVIAVNSSILSSVFAIPIVVVSPPCGPTPGFNEVTYADDLLPGKYNLNFFDDSNNDSKLDANGQTFQTSISLPCR